MGETQKALDYVNEAIEHTPTLVELYSCKARIYKHAGDPMTSARCYEEVGHIKWKMSCYSRGLC